MLGKLSRFLRILGYDTRYRKKENLTKMFVTSATEGRIILTRSKRVYNIAHSIGIKVYYFSVVYVVDQLKMLQRNNLIKITTEPLNPRCSECNGILKKTDKEEVINRLPEGTARRYDSFWQCMDCKRVYWIGQHWKDIKLKLEAASG